MALLEEYDVPLEGARRGRRRPQRHRRQAGRAAPAAGERDRHVCHSRTKDLGAHTREADILVVAVGQAGVIGPDDVREGATVIDVGMNRSDDGVVGDVDPGRRRACGPHHARSRAGSGR